MTLRTRVLLDDGALVLEAPDALAPLLGRWLPLLPYDAPAPAPPRARVRLAEADGPAPPLPDGRPALRLGRVDAWIEGDAARMAGDLAGSRAAVALADGRATIEVPRGAPADAEWEVYSMATLGCALLLGRMGRALVHAAAVVGPGGGAWLLAGDTHAGKTTTCANLVRAGWRYVSDDHVVLAPDGAGGVRVEGWPRPFHLDEGFEAGAPLRVRGEVDPRARFPGAWLRAAPLAGALFPRVVPERPTEAEPAAGADALAALLRQSPWLLGDRAAAPAVLALLRAAAALPSRALRLGLDTYADPALLAARLACAGVR